MTEIPLILTARVDPRDIEPFDHLRQRHFPPERNFLRAHLTLFHRLPGEERAAIDRALSQAVARMQPFTAVVNGLRHLGAGVCFTMESPPLHRLRDALRQAFEPWLGAQDKQGWRPHITVQNKVTKAMADELLADLQAGFQPTEISITGLDLWRYQGGPWAEEAAYPFAPKGPAAGNPSG